jgi:hypothetical protein
MCFAAPKVNLKRELSEIAVPFTPVHIKAAATLAALKWVLALPSSHRRYAAWQRADPLCDFSVAL